MPQLGTVSCLRYSSRTGIHARSLAVSRRLRRAITRTAKMPMIAKPIIDSSRYVWSIRDLPVALAGPRADGWRDRIVLRRAGADHPVERAVRCGR